MDGTCFSAYFFLARHSRGANHAACACLIHIIMTHIHCVGLSWRRQVLTVHVVGIIGTKSMALKGILAGHPMVARVHLFSHLVIECSGRPSARRAYVCFALVR